MSAWFTDRISPDDYHRHRLKKILVRTRTAFQKVVLADSPTLGRCLILDDEIQSAARDEFIYHECLAHPAMALHPRPQRVLVMGGGEGATARELLRYPEVKQVTMVDIDGAVVAFCRRYLTRWHQGAFAHRKLRLVIGDARKYILKTPEQFDIIISDLPTPTDSGPVRTLYTRTFYRQVLSRLKPGGIFVVQSGSGSPAQLAFHARVHQALTGLFKVVRPFYAFVPSFDVPWAFLMATQGRDPRFLSAARVDGRIAGFSRKLKFYDGETHEGLFRVPKYLRDRLR